MRISSFLMPSLVALSSRSSFSTYLTRFECRPLRLDPPFAYPSSADEPSMSIRRGSSSSASWSPRSPVLLKNEKSEPAESVERRRPPGCFSSCSINECSSEYRLSGTRVRRGMLEDFEEAVVGGMMATVFARAVPWLPSHVYRVFNSRTVPRCGSGKVDMRKVRMHMSLRPVRQNSVAAIFGGVIRCARVGACVVSWDGQRTNRLGVSEVERDRGAASARVGSNGGLRWPVWGTSAGACGSVLVGGRGQFFKYKLLRLKSTKCGVEEMASAI